jgi:hypothetical protein
MDGQRWWDEARETWCWASEGGVFDVSKGVSEE